MARFGKYTGVIYLLFAIAALEFIGLAIVLIADRTAPQTEITTQETSAPVPVTEEESSAIPDWLTPAEETVREKERPEGEQSAREILTENRLVAHGMGSIAGETTLNCLEGFQSHYQRGVRVFEADLRLTADQQVVLRHDWRADWQWGISETNIPTLEEFLRKPLLQKYTPLSFRDLLLLMEQYPDICIITDTKFTDAEIVTMQFEAMLQDAEDLGLSYLFDRIIIQVYTPLMYRVVDNIHHFPHYLYTLYAEGFSRTEEDFRERAEFCAENDILGITMWDYWWRTEFVPLAEEYGLTVCVHTVNDRRRAIALLENGVDVIYTDSLLPYSLVSADTAQAEEQTEQEGEETNGTDGKDLIE